MRREREQEKGRWREREREREMDLCVHRAVILILQFCFGWYLPRSDRYILVEKLVESRKHKYQFKFKSLTDWKIDPSYCQPY
jgi:hypothetical protein